MQIGIIDGPGNELAVYVAAILALSVLVRRGSVLICCHDGNRSLAIAIMYLITKRGKVSRGPGFCNCWGTWDNMLRELRDGVGELPAPHECHKEAADRLPMSLFECLL